MNRLDPRRVRGGRSVHRRPDRDPPEHQLGGGTSQAAPIWAGMTALINQYLVDNGGKSVGNINPLLYHVAKGSKLPQLPGHHRRWQRRRLPVEGFDLVFRAGKSERRQPRSILLDEQKAEGGGLQLPVGRRIGVADRGVPGWAARTFGTVISVRPAGPPVRRQCCRAGCGSTPTQPRRGSASFVRGHHHPVPQLPPPSRRVFRVGLIVVTAAAVLFALLGWHGPVPRRAYWGCRILFAVYLHEIDFPAPCRAATSRWRVGRVAVGLGFAWARIAGPVVADAYLDQMGGRLGLGQLLLCGLPFPPRTRSSW